MVSLEEEIDCVARVLLLMRLTAWAITRTTVRLRMVM